MKYNENILLPQCKALPCAMLHMAAVGGGEVQQGDHSNHDRRCNSVVKDYRDLLLRLLPGKARAKVNRVLYYFGGRVNLIELLIDVWEIHLINPAPNQRTMLRECGT